MIVVDASVAVKWLLPETGSEAAMNLLRARDILVAPDLLRVEVASAITRRARRGELDADDAKATLRLWIEMLEEGVVQLTANMDDLREAGHLAIQLAHPIQDCLYLALARRQSAKLVTADRMFATKATTLHPSVETIAL